MILFEDIDHGIIFLEASGISISYSERCNMINSKVLNFGALYLYITYILFYLIFLCFFTGKIKESGH